MNLLFAISSEKRYQKNFFDIDAEHKLDSIFGIVQIKNIKWFLEEYFLSLFNAPSESVSNLLTVELFITCFHEFQIFEQFQVDHSMVSLGIQKTGRFTMSPK